MQAECKAKTKAGTRCAAHAGTDGYCFFHSPQRAAERARAHRRGGLSRIIPKVSGDPVTIATPADALALVNKVILDTWELENSPARSRVLLQAATDAMAVLQIGELEARVAALEQALHRREGGNNT